MSALDSIKYHIPPYGLQGNWRCPADFPIEIFHKWVIRVLEDNAFIAYRNEEFDRWMHILKTMPPTAKAEVDAFWDIFGERNSTLEETAMEHLISTVVQAIGYVLGPHNHRPYCDYFSEIDMSIFSSVEEYVKEQCAEMSKYYGQDPLPEKYYQPLLYLTVLKYENWLREEIFNHDLVEQILVAP